jgi:pimeloyl-ACP methyl ester carboxylesterase
MLLAETLVMIPGLCSDAAVWKRTIAALDGKVRCLVGDTLSDTTLAGMARRILAHAPDHFALAGLSMGGMVALELTRIAPKRVTHLALVDTNARPDTFGRKAYRRIANLYIGMGSNFERAAKGSLKSLVHPLAPEDVRRELVEMSVRVGHQTYVRQNRAVIARGDLRPILPTIAAPTTVIVGSEDQVTPPDMSQEIHDLVPGSTLQVISDCGHLAPIEKPTIVASALQELMSRSR